MLFRSAVCTDALLTQSLPGGDDDDDDDDDRGGNLVAEALNDAMRDMPTEPSVRAMPDPAPAAEKSKVDYYGNYKKLREAMKARRLQKRV